MPLATNYNLEGEVFTKTYVSNHIHVMLAELMVKFSIPSTIPMRCPQATERILYPLEGEEGFFEDALQAGAQFPLSQEVCELLDVFYLAPSQLAPNGWRFALGLFAQ